VYFPAAGAADHPAGCVHDLEKLVFLHGWRVIIEKEPCQNISPPPDRRLRPYSGRIPPDKIPLKRKPPFCYGLEFMKTIVRFPFIAVVAWTLFLSSAWSSPPEVSADSAILIDAETGTVLMEKKPDRPYFPASITKIMTAHLALKHGDLDDPITVSRKAAYGIEPGSSSIALKPGEKVTLRDVLYGLMLRSANECGNIIAEYVSGSNAAFAGEMNREAKRLGCTGTRFKNPHGLHHPDHVVTARGMALISREAMKNPDFRKIVQTRFYPFPDTNVHTHEERGNLRNKNKMLHPKKKEHYAPATGIKAGYTTKSLHTFAASAKKDGHEVIAVLLRMKSKSAM
jgi:D-alanyl-D-alanine carboxypeptidase